MNIQPIEIWGHWGAPNPWKVCMILEDLNLPYKIHYMELPEAKHDEYLKINPNGRLPSIKDPNTRITLWESGAIILYLIDQYDDAHKLSYDSPPEKYIAQQWLAFQISGQGPYYGQATYFARFHPERLPSATERYINEMLRVVDVLDAAIKATNSGWLVGEKCTYADIAFVTWAKVAEGLLKEIGRQEELEKRTSYVAWLGRLESRDSVKKILDQMAAGRVAHGLK